MTNLAACGWTTSMVMMSLFTSKLTGPKARLTLHKSVVFKAKVYRVSDLCSAKYHECLTY